MSVIYGRMATTTFNAPQEHLADEPILVHRLLVFALRYFCPHLDSALAMF